MKNWMNLYFQEVLNKDRLDLLPRLKFFTDKWFYLAGWTALALQLWHRKSIDFDFFIWENIDTQKLYNNILQEFKWEKVKKIFEENNTLYVEINNIKVSFISFKHKLLKKLIKTQYLNIVDFIDIGAMKLWTIQNRATNKDYVDLYFIFKKIKLTELIDKFYIKFWDVVNKNLIFKSLIYFDDIEVEDLIMNKKLDFSEVKKFLEKLVIKIK
jgi:hypothetical protein